MAEMGNEISSFESFVGQVEFREAIKVTYPGRKSSFHEIKVRFGSMSSELVYEVRGTFSGIEFSVENNKLPVGGGAQDQEISTRLL